MIVVVACVMPLPILAANEVELVMWHWLGQHKDLLDNLAKDFQKEYPDVVITQNIFRTATEYIASLSAAMAGGKGPDIIAVFPGSHSVRLASSDQMVDFMPYLNADPSWKNSFYPQVLNTMVINGQAIALPVATNNVQIFYNKKIFEEYGFEVPTTLDELKHIAKTLKTNSIEPVGFIGGEPQNAAWAFYWPAGQIAGDEIIRQADLGKIPWDKTPTLLESAKVAQDIIESVIMEGAAGLKEPEVVTSFLTGRAAMMMNGCWIITTLRKSQPADFEMDVFPLPAVKPGLKQNVLSQLGLAFGVNKNSESKELAVEFVKFITSDERKLQYVKTMCLVPTGPVDPSVLAKAAEEINEPLWLKFASAAPIGTTRILFTPEVENTLYSGVQGMLVGDVTPEQLMEMTEKASQKAGERNFKIGE